MPGHAWESIWSNWYKKPEAALLMLDPYGGRMGSISPPVTPFPHRNYVGPYFRAHYASCISS
jgi:hypothetical protein